MNGLTLQTFQVCTLINSFQYKSSCIDMYMQVIQAVVMILESEHTSEIKEQTLCILGNVADGDSSKEYIMNNDDILKKILDYMVGEADCPNLNHTLICLCSALQRC